MAGERLDAALVRAGLFPSVDAAARAVMAGQVRIDGRRADKAGMKVSPDAGLEVVRRREHVGRGALKLAGALDFFGISPEGMVCVDIGASTGGFTECLLRRGAVLVHAVDVGRGQLAWKLRNDPRVRCREGTNARHLVDGDLDPPPGFAVGDVSFISLTAILPAVFRLLPAGGGGVFLIKPQFEAPRESVGAGGIVRDEGVRRACVEKIQTFVENGGHEWVGVVESPITGRDGNVEFLAFLRRGGGA
jgi:23S rRNA (cytidine1920-2'-O)/16S rRNA (cytidine1409-2'-O)-methyltransferase